ncbi:MAG TPA: PQQ-binding-like beta-propeller repeat protein, partial [Gemmataceae bacterium]|nr:PQQ-binding-like beta-propeller repeat protein [Gemmataceae bacterium]
VGIGFSSVAVVGDLVVTLGDRNDGCHLIAVSRNDGKRVWDVQVGAKGDGGGYRGSRGTPTVDGDRVYALCPKGELVCCGLKDGAKVWEKHLAKDFQGSSGGWQYAESPLVDGDKLVCTPGGKDATVAALNKATGDVLWKGATKQGEAAGYSSVMVSHAGGVKQYVTLTSNGVVSFDAEKGKLLWQYGTTNERFAGNTANIPTVVLFDDPNKIFAATGYGRGAGLISLSRAGDKFNVKEVYWSPKLKNKHGGIIRVGKHLYGDHDDTGRIWCADSDTGKFKWERDDGAKGSGSASMCYADGMLYVRFQNGYVSLVDANPSAYKLAGTFKVPNGTGDCWAHPVVVGGKCYVREKETIWCYDVAKK